MTLIGKWGTELWVEKSDTIRVIGTFNKQNQFHLLMDDQQPNSSDQMV